MADPVPEPDPQDFPSWPFKATALYDHLLHDAAGLAEAAGRIADPAAALNAEGAYAVQLWRDLAQGWWDLALAPYTAAMAAMAAMAGRSPAEPAPDPAKSAD